jgi:uncharacterized protein YyaL (SSP411 family)
MHTNRLASEKSPYLLQHAHNPVDWQPWDEQAFAKARSEDKPIFLSVGYSTCHWCHVMERESFESAEIAALLNRHFVPIKVDREERPDVDRIYMHFVQASTGSGGWPMSVWLTPDLKPFFGGTYFPPENRYGRAGFATLLERLAEAWKSDRDAILESAQKVIEQLEQQASVSSGGRKPDQAALESGFNIFRRTFDSRYGGFGEAPKFPRPSVHNFLLRYYSRTQNEEAAQMVLATLRAMAKGGMNDQLGGGFHRYSVDEKWFVPHFEKMLYDQAQLAISYLEAFQITADQGYASIARQIFDYVQRDMTDRAGGFFSAEDADSVIDPAHPEIKGEGAYYIWSQSEIESIAGQPAAKWFAYAYGVEEGGNVHNDPHAEFTGKNILYQGHTLEDTARHFERPFEEVQAAVLQVERKLLEARSQRVRPHLDDKILTAWNGLMISAFARGGAILNEPRYADSARRAARFVIERMYNPETGILLRRFREDEAAIPGFLDDYAFFTQALLDLYEAQFDPLDLELAGRLSDKMLELFEDGANGAFFSTGPDDASLVMRIKEDYDGAEPSGNSVAVLNLLRLAQMTGNPRYRESADKALEAFASRINTTPHAVPQMMVAFAFSIAKPRQVILAGRRSAPDTLDLVRELHRRFLPDKVALLVAEDESRAKLAANLPAIEGMHMVNGKATAYVCENYACQLPVSDVAQLAELLR